MQEHGEVGEADEARIAALFREAASGAPPPGFDAAQVAATSRRITRRRRSAVAGAALAVLAVAGVGVVAGLGGPGEATVTAASGQAERAGSAGGSAAGADDAARAMAPEAAAAPDAGGAAAGSPIAPAAPDVAVPDVAVPDATVPDATGPDAAAGGGPVPGAAAVPPIGTPLGPGTGECADRQDPALRALVDEALPEVVGAREAATTLECRPGGERGVALEVGGGVLTVTYLPPGPVATAPDGAQTASTASGGTLVLASRSERAGDPAPFADRFPAMVAYLASRL